jgi:hypothetical protein
MSHYICTTCGTQHAESEAPPGRCVICEDERQYVGWQGQLWTTLDDVVVPPSSAVIEGVPSPSVQSVCPGSRVQHGALPADPLVQRLVAQALASSPIPTWGPADCTGLTS